MSQVSWQNLAFNVSSTPVTSSGFATLQLTVAQGQSFQSSLLGQNQPVPIVGTNGTSLPVAIEVSGSGWAGSVAVSPIDLYMISIYESSAGGLNIRGVSNYTLSAASLVAPLALGCPRGCGARGRCAQPSANATEPACECECGWGGADCSQAQGFCAQFQSQSSAANGTCPVPPPMPPPSPCPAPGGACGPREVFDPASDACVCRPGWAGSGCARCTSDAACEGLFPGQQGIVCQAAQAYQEHTAFLDYDCSLQGTGLADVLAPGTFYVTCNTTGASGEGSSSGGQAPAIPGVQPFCEVNFALAGRTSNPIQCIASDCSFAANSTRVVCASTSCACASPSACADLEGVFAAIANNPAVIECDAQSLCTFDIQDFFVQLAAPCQNAQCVNPASTLGAGSYQLPSSQRAETAAVAALPALITAALAALLGAHALLSGALGGFQGGAAGAGAGAASAAPADSPAAARVLSFQSLSCATPPPPRGWRAWVPAWLRPAGELRPVLRGVSGSACRGEMLGVLGPSGAGKTTLLAMLAESADDLGPRARLRGDVLLDGRRARPGELARGVAYVPQDDALLATLTVEECVRYSALLRARGSGARDLDARVRGVLEELGLAHVAGSRVGGGTAGRGISGGERRRTTIAMELVTRPRVLVLDEPTSGLDSHTALSLVCTLRNLAAAGRIVVLSMHQPSPAAFGALDRVLVLADGRAVFQGSPAAAEARCAAAGLPCPPGQPAAEHLLHCAADPERAARLERAGEAEGDARGSEDDGGALKSSEEGEGKGGGGKGERAGRSRKLWDGSAASGVLTELAVLFWRTGVDIGRNPSLLMLHWGVSLLMGIFVGAIFFQVGADISGAQNRAGGLFFALAFFAFTSLSTVDLFVAERKMVAREVRGGYYRPASYLLAKAVLDGLLLRAVPALLYAVPFYPMMGLASGGAQVGLFLATLTAFALAVGALSLLVSAASASAGRASLVMNVVLLLSLLVGGFFVNVASIPGWIRWLHYLSLFYYAYSALMINELSDLLLNFVLQGYAAVSGVRGTTFLAIIGVQPDALWRSVVVLDCLWAALLALAVLALYLGIPRARARAALRAEDVA